MINMFMCKEKRSEIKRILKNNKYMYCTRQMLINKILMLKKRRYTYF